MAVLIPYTTKWPARLAKVHESQLVNYFVATGKEVGLLLNFGEEKVEVKRKVKDLGKVLPE